MRTMGFIYIITLVVLSACGQKDDPVATAAPVQTTTRDSSAYIGGRCGEQVARDYYNLTGSQNSLCGRAQGDRMDSHRCVEAAQDFLRKYPAVNCTVEERGQRFGEFHTRRIEAREIQELIDRNRRG